MPEVCDDRVSEVGERRRARADRRKKVSIFPSAFRAHRLGSAHLQPACLLAARVLPCVRLGHREQDIVAASQLEVRRADLHHRLATEDVGTPFEGMNVTVDPPIGRKPAQGQLRVHRSRTSAYQSATRITTSMCGVIVGPVIAK